MVKIFSQLNLNTWPYYTFYNFNHKILAIKLLE